MATQQQLKLGERVFFMLLGFTMMGLLSNVYISEKYGRMINHTYCDYSVDNINNH